MGESATQTVKEIEDTRIRLQDEIRELEGRLPRPAVWGKRLIGLAVGGGVGGAAFWFAARRLRKRQKPTMARVAGEAVPVTAVVHVLPEKWGDTLAEALQDGEWKRWLALSAGAWAVFRLAEVRQLRRMNRTLLTGAR